jgi:hypothetical protein
MQVWRVCPITKQAVAYDDAEEHVEVTERGLEIIQWPCTSCWKDEAGPQWHVVYRRIDGHEEAAPCNAAHR